MLYGQWVCVVYTHKGQETEVPLYAFRTVTDNAISQNAPVPEMGYVISLNQRRQWLYSFVERYDGSGTEWEEIDADIEDSFQYVQMRCILEPVSARYYDGVYSQISNHWKFWQWWG